MDISPNKIKKIDRLYNFNNDGIDIPKQPTKLVSVALVSFLIGFLSTNIYYVWNIENTTELLIEKHRKELQESCKSIATPITQAQRASIAFDYITSGLEGLDTTKPVITPMFKPMEER